MKDLINRSYKAIRKRGKITDDTLRSEFIDKIEEELSEVRFYHSDKNYIAELIDIANACICAVNHEGYDFIKEYEKCVIHQETRKD